MTRRHEEIDIMNTHIGKRLFELRLSRGLSRKELGAKIGVSHQQCQKYEQGTNNISVGRLMLMAQVLGEPVEYFFLGISGTKEASVIYRSHQRMCAEISRNFMKISNNKHKYAVHSLVRSLAPG